jgi:homogentisate 1,2-dioxygenase
MPKEKTSFIEGIRTMTMAGDVNGRAGLEFTGLVYGRNDANEEGFVPGGMSLHDLMLAHGPDSPGFWKASTAGLRPHKLENTMAFMFETRFAAEPGTKQDKYAGCWTALRKRFNGKIEEDGSE